MFELILVACSTLGGPSSGEDSATWVRMIRNATTANAVWMEYYKTSRPPWGPGVVTPSRILFPPVFVAPTMQWAVPNLMLPGPPAGPPVLPFPEFGQYPMLPSPDR